MSKVFVGGSRRISRLNEQVRRRLERVIEKNLTVLVGDANGADKAVQKYLAERNYENGKRRGSQDPSTTSSPAAACPTRTSC